MSFRKRDVEPRRQVDVESDRYRRPFRVVGEGAREVSDGLLTDELEFSVEEGVGDELIRGDPTGETQMLFSVNK